MDRHALAVCITHLAVPSKNVDLAFSFDYPIAAQLANEGSVFVDPNHTLALLKLTLQTKNDWLPDARDGVKVRDDKSGWHNSKPLLRPGETKAGHPLGKDHGACRTAGVDRAPLPGPLCSIPGPAALHG